MVFRKAASYGISFVQVAFSIVVLGLPAISQAPVGHWTFDDGSGVTAIDASSAVHAARLFHGVVWVAGEIDGAVSAHAGANQYLRIPPVDLSSTTAVTVALWVNRTYSKAGGHVLLEVGPDYNQSTTGFAILPDDDICQGIQISLRGDVGATSNCYSPPSSGTWHHMAVVLDKAQTAGNGITFYVDGILQSPNRSLEASTNTNDFGSNPLYLFSRGGKTMFDTGSIDDLSLYNRALNSAEIQQIYRSGVLVSLAIAPQNASMTAGTLQRFTAIGTYGDGSRRNLTNRVVWSSTTPSVAAIGQSGYVLAAATGSTTFQATEGGITGLAGATVVPSRSLHDPISQPTVSVDTNAGATGIRLDGAVHSVHDNGSTSNYTSAVSIGTPTAGDLITCEVTFDGHNANSLVSVTDNNNGSYSAGVPTHLNTTLIQWFGIYYKQAAIGSPTVVVLKTSKAQPWAAISCQAWAGAATFSPLDSGFLQSRDALSTANPTTGPNKMPSANGELVIAGLGLYSSGSPKAGTNYTLIDSAAASQWWPEYWIQSTASSTGGNFVGGTDNFTDMMAAFKPASVTGAFMIAASPAALSIAPGNTGTAILTTTVSGGFNNAITLSASGLPGSTTASFSPNPIAAPGAGTSTMTINVGTGTLAGSYPITVMGSGGSLQQSTRVTLIVTSGPDFTVSTLPASLTVMRGYPSTSVITTTVGGGFNSAIALSASGVPIGTTVSFGTNPIAAPGSGSSTVTIAVGGTTLTGTYAIKVTGTGSGTQHSATITLTVTAHVALSWTASPTPGVVGYNVYRAATSGGPYTKLNSSLISSTSYSDTLAQSANTYYYVTTAVDSVGSESLNSNQAVATVR